MAMVRASLIMITAGTSPTVADCPEADGGPRRARGVVATSVDDQGGARQRDERSDGRPRVLASAASGGCSWPWMPSAPVAMIRCVLAASW